MNSTELPFDPTEYSKNDAIYYFPFLVNTWTIVPVLIIGFCCIYPFWGIFEVICKLRLKNHGKTAYSKIDKKVSNENNKKCEVEFEFNGIHKTYKLVDKKVYDQLSENSDIKIIYDPCCPKLNSHLDLSRYNKNKQIGQFECAYCTLIICWLLFVIGAIIWIYYWVKQESIGSNIDNIDATLMCIVWAMVYGVICGINMIIQSKQESNRQIIDTPMNADNQITIKQQNNTQQIIETSSLKRNNSDAKQNEMSPLSNS